MSTRQSRSDMECGATPPLLFLMAGPKNKQKTKAADKAPHSKIKTIHCKKLSSISCPLPPLSFVMPAECRPQGAAGFKTICRRKVMFATKLILGPLVVLALIGSMQATRRPRNRRMTSRSSGSRNWWAIGRTPTPKPTRKKSAVALRYRLIAADSVLVETDFPGTAKEMLTMYHRDGDQLMLTHYCRCGNQPRMRARAGAAANEVSVRFRWRDEPESRQGLSYARCGDSVRR